VKDGLFPDRVYRGYGVVDDFSPTEPGVRLDRQGMLEGILRVPKHFPEVRVPTLGGGVR
jgi:hypothetical protein